MPTIIRYILLTALRDRLFLALIGILIIAVGISAALSQTAMVEQHESTITFSATAARLLLAIGLAVFVCFHVRYAFDSREIDVMLSRPISRARLVVAYWLGFSLVATLLIAISVLIIAFLMPSAYMLVAADAEGHAVYQGVDWHAIGSANWLGFTAWALSLLAEMLIVVAVALFASVTLRSAVTSVMACLVIYVVGRMMGFFLATVQSKMIFKSELVNTTAKWIIEGIAIITPRLDMFAKSMWLVYPPQQADLTVFNSLVIPANQVSWALFGAQSAVIIPFLLLLTIADFSRRQF